MITPIILTRSRKSQPKKLNLKAIFKSRNVKMLVGFRSTHNFIDINVTRQLNIFLNHTKDLTIMVINGQTIKGLGRCKVLVQIK
jgi:hypothetical protein